LTLESNILRAGSAKIPIEFCGDCESEHVKRGPGDRAVKIFLNLYRYRKCCMLLYNNLYHGCFYVNLSGDVR